MVRVLLVEVVVRLGLQLRGKILEDAGYQGVDGVLLGRVAVPDGDEVGVEADGEANAADLVSYLEKNELDLEKRNKRAHIIERTRQTTHTIVNDALQLLANGQQLDASPKVRADGLWHAECPAAAVDVAAVLPDGLEAGLEEVDGLAHLDVLDGGVVVVAPKVLDRLDLRANLFELGRVLGLASGFGLLFLGTFYLVSTFKIQSNRDSRG